MTLKSACESHRVFIAYDNSSWETSFRGAHLTSTREWGHLRGLEARNCNRTQWCFCCIWSHLRTANPRFANTSYQEVTTAATIIPDYHPLTRLTKVKSILLLNGKFVLSYILTKAGSPDEINDELILFSNLKLLTGDMALQFELQRSFVFPLRCFPCGSFIICLFSKLMKYS